MKNLYLSIILLFWLNTLFSQDSLNVNNNIPFPALRIGVSFGANIVDYQNLTKYFQTRNTPKVPSVINCGGVHFSFYKKYPFEAALLWNNVNRSNDSIGLKINTIHFNFSIGRSFVINNGKNILKPYIGYSRSVAQILIIDKVNVSDVLNSEFVQLTNHNPIIGLEYIFINQNCKSVSYLQSSLIFQYCGPLLKATQSYGNNNQKFLKSNLAGIFFGIKSTIGAF